MKPKIVFEDLLPGETPIDDISGLRVKGISTRKQLNTAEAENIRKALVKYFGDGPRLEVAELDFEWAKSLHGEMYGDVWVWAGQFRTVNLNIGCPYQQISNQLYNLFEDLNYWRESEMGPIEQGARLHHKAVEIHPFVNGNGRWGRMLTNIWLTANGLPDIAWPEATIGGVSPIRGQYIQALREADVGEISALLRLHTEHARKSD